jgi:muramidase (flagellum-specific)
MEQRKFLAMVGPLAQADMQKSGILASLTIAQAILESGWGASELATKANALFGIKADARWSGKAYSKDTKECYDGATYTTITALFRAYDSWAESVADHSAFLLANKRYAAVVGERDYKVACKAIKAAGYATDPGYPQKLIGLIEKYGLTVYDGKAEQEDKTSMNISITKKTSTHNTTAAAGRAIRYIVVHYTAGVTSKPGSAAGTASYFGSTSKQVSADFIVDDGGAVQYNGDIRNRYTWHCGGGKYNTKGGAYYGKATNRNTIGIEVCSTNDTGKMTVANDSHWRFTDKVVSNLVELVKYLMAEYGIDAAHVIRHYDVNGKPCPGIIGWNEDTGSAAKWAAFKARLGAATPGGQTGGSTNTGTATGNTALTYKVGDIVQFAGGKHYANSQATSGTTVKPGPAKVTAVATAGKHPYHLVHTDSTSTVYGWVDAAAITGKAGTGTTAAKTYTVKAGDSLWRIAAQQLGNGARYKEIKTLNGLKNNTIHAGQVLKLPN